MALARTSVLTDNNPFTIVDGNAYTYTTASFTPPASSLLVLVFHAANDILAGADIRDGLSVSGGGLTWTRQLGPGAAILNAEFVTTGELWTAPVGGSPASMTITLSHSGNAQFASGVGTIVVDAYTGYDTVTPIGAKIDGDLGTNGSTPNALTLPSSPVTTSIVHADAETFSNANDSTASAGSGYTQVRNIQNAVNGNGTQETETRTGSTSTTVSWTTTSSGQTLWFNWGFGIEIREAGATLNTAWFRPSEECLPRKFQADTRGPAFVSTFRTAGISGIAWRRDMAEVNPLPPVRFQPPPPAFISTFKTAGISGIAWSRDETESNPRSSRRFERPPAWDPQPIGVVVTAPPNGWLTTSADQPRRRPPIDQPVVVQFTPPQTAGWPQLAQDRLWPRFRLSDAALAWNPAAPTPQFVGWWMLAQDRLPLRVRWLLDVPAINLTPPTTPSTIDGIAWFEPFDRLPRIPVPAPRDAAPAFGFPIVDTSAGVTGMAWFEPWDRDKRSVRVTIEASPAISLTPDTLPVGIFGMSWFAPPDRDRPRFTPTVETFPAWGPQFIVQVAPPPSTGGDDFLVLARRRGRR